MSSPVIQLKNITKTYVNGPTRFDALKGVNLCINQGEYLSITGPSGSGKSTLMHIIGLLDTPSSGEIIINGRQVSGLGENRLAQIRNETIGFVFQQFNLLPKTSSLENTILPLIYSDVPKREHESRGEAMLQKVGLGDKLKNTPAQLSGGQQQRVAIARSLINDPKIIMADEPTGNLDSKSGKEIIELLAKLNSEGRTIVLVTHDMELAKKAQRMIVIKDGKIVGEETCTD